MARNYFDSRVGETESRAGTSAESSINYPNSTPTRRFHLITSFAIIADKHQLSWNVICEL